MQMFAEDSHSVSAIAPSFFFLPLSLSEVAEAVTEGPELQLQSLHDRPQLHQRHEGRVHNSGRVHHVSHLSRDKVLGGDLGDRLGHQPHPGDQHLQRELE